MNSVRIIFTENDVSLPDGSCIGIIGEHNAVQLVITLPESMVTGMSFHTVTVNGAESALVLADHDNIDGAYRSENTVYFPLTASYTDKLYIDLYVTAYKQIGEAVQIIDKTVTVHGLRLLPSAPGNRTVGGLAAEIYQIKDLLYYILNMLNGSDSRERQKPIPGGLVSKVMNISDELDAIRDDLPSAKDISDWNQAAADKHTHENDEVLDSLSERRERLAYNGKIIGIDVVDDLPIDAHDGQIVYLRGVGLVIRSDDESHVQGWEIEGWLPLTYDLLVERADKLLSLPDRCMTKDYFRRIISTFRMQDGRFQVDTSTGLAYIGEDGHLYVDTDAAGNITENNRLEVLV